MRALHPFAWVACVLQLACGPAPNDDSANAGDDTAEFAAAAAPACERDLPADADDPLDPDLPREPAIHPDVTPEEGPWIRSYGAYIADRTTGEVLYSRKADRLRPMASVAKLMGALAYLQTEPDLDEVIRIARADAYTPSFTRSPLWIGTSYRAADLLAHALLESDNRAMAALARSTGMDADAFASAMNALAGDLGMQRSEFVEPTGISGDNRSTPFEMGVLLEACLDEPVLAEILGRENLAFERVDRPRRLVAHSTNMLTRMDHWRVFGSKTGYTCLAGSCLVMAAEVEGRDLLMSFMGHPDVEMRFNDAGEVRWWLREQ